MDNLFLADWGGPGRKVRQPEEFWLDPPASGFGRLATAIVIIGVAACLLDHAAFRSETGAAALAPYNASMEGGSK